MCSRVASGEKNWNLDMKNNLFICCLVSPGLAQAVESQHKEESSRCHISVRSRLLPAQVNTFIILRH